MFVVTCSELFAWRGGLGNDFQLLLEIHMAGRRVPREQTWKEDKEEKE